MSPIRVVLADDHPVVLAGVRALLKSTADILVIGEAASGYSALEIIASKHPDVAIVDISMPDINGMDLADRLGELCPNVLLVALTVHEDQAYLQRLLQAGVRGYLLKRSAADELARAIRAVVAGGVYLDPYIAEKALNDAPDPEVKGSASDDAELSPRENEVLRLTSQGFANKEIATRLNIGIKSVETYKARAAGKLGLRTRAEIVRYGASRGWIEGLQS